MSKIITSCLFCKTNFESYSSNKRKFCSNPCRFSFFKTEEGSNYKSEKILKTKEIKNTSGKEVRECLYCNKQFTCLKSEIKSFCSKECRYSHLSDNKENMLESMHKTNLEKYGYKYHMSNLSIINKMRETVLLKYGSNHPRFSEQASEKRINTFLEKYGKPYAINFSKESKDEKEIISYIKNILPNIDIEENNRTLLKGKEIDIYIPSLNIGIEYDGLYYHCESKIKDKKYHVNKTIALEKLGIRLIHIFSDEWKNRKDQVKSKLLSIFGVQNKKIYARKCYIKKISRKECSLFLNQHHIQGVDKSKIKIGLFHGNELVAVMTFSLRRIIMGGVNRPNEYELSRYCTSNQVIGGASKILKYFIKNYNPHKIISYADRRWSVGNLYEKIGFTKIGYSSPNYWYTHDYANRLYRYNFRKSVLVNSGAPANKTEWEIMQDLGYDRIWDCGVIKYEWVNDY